MWSFICEIFFVNLIFGIRAQIVGFINAVAVCVCLLLSYSRDSNHFSLTHTYTLAISAFPNDWFQFWHAIKYNFNQPKSNPIRVHIHFKCAIICSHTRGNSTTSTLPTAPTISTNALHHTENSLQNEYLFDCCHWFSNCCWSFTWVYCYWWWFPSIGFAMFFIFPFAMHALRLFC